MIIKQYLPYRFSREGCIPDRIVLRRCDQSAEECIATLTEGKKTAHFHLGLDGCITALTPLSCAANLLGPTGRDPAPESNELPLGRRGILILTECRNFLSEEQKEPLIRLLKRIQKEALRIYGVRFPFCREGLIQDSTPLCPSEELLEQALYCSDTTRVFRVLTGSYRNRRDAEESVQRLSSVGIAAYITEVVDP